MVLFKQCIILLLFRTFRFIFESLFPGGNHTVNFRDFRFWCCRCTLLIQDCQIVSQLFFHLAFLLRERSEFRHQGFQFRLRLFVCPDFGIIKRFFLGIVDICSVIGKFFTHLLDSVQHFNGSLGVGKGCGKFIIKCIQNGFLRFFRNSIIELAQLLVLGLGAVFGINGKKRITLIL